MVAAIMTTDQLSVTAIITIILVATLRLQAVGSLDKLVEFAAIQPHAPAIGAQVNLDPLAFMDLQDMVARGAFHLNSPWL